jgi:transcriptional regulator with XRE-family HTH domain
MERTRNDLSRAQRLFLVRGPERARAAAQALGQRLRAAAAQARALGEKANALSSLLEGISEEVGLLVSSQHVDSPKVSELDKGDAEPADRVGNQRIGAYLRQAREAGLDKMSITSLAEKLGLSLAFVWQIENGKARIPDSQIIDWSASVGINALCVAAMCLYYYRPNMFQLLTGQHANRGEEKDLDAIVRELSGGRLKTEGELEKLIFPASSANRGEHKLKRDRDQYLSFYLRDQKKKLGLSQEKLRSAIGYKSATTVAQIENGAVHIRDEKLMLWIDAIEADIKAFCSLCLMVYAPKTFDVIHAGLSGSQTGRQCRKRVKR